MEKFRALNTNTKRQLTENELKSISAGCSGTQVYCPGGVCAAEVDGLSFKLTKDQVVGMVINPGVPSVIKG